MSADTTIVLTFRSRETAGSVTPGRAFIFDPAKPGDRTDYPLEKLGAEAADRNVLFVVHGFNVNAQSGMTSGRAMEQDFLSPGAPFPISANDMVIAVLWPGDWNIKVVNYSWEYEDAVAAGGFLCDVITRHFQRAASISMVSHSLGARVVLTAAARLKTMRVRELCVTAAAADRDCLTKQYPRAVENSDRVTVLRSMRDWTLMLAYPAGDFLSDLIGDDDSPFGGALGRFGPKPTPPANVTTMKIASRPHDASGQKHEMLSDFDHTDYFPSGKSPRPAAPRKSDTVSRFIAATFAGAPPYWR